jgi:HlyD family secretion protein
MKRRYILAAGVVVLGVVGLVWWHWLAQPGRKAVAPARLTLSGNIEAHESILSFTQVQAPIIDLAFEEGAYVTRGTVLARVDDRLYRRQLMIDQAAERVAGSQVAVNESAVAAQRSSVASDELDLAQKTRDAGRAEELVKTAATSVQARDLIRTAAQQSAAALAHDQAMLRVAATNVALAKANSEAAAAKRSLDEVTVDYTILRAPFDGVISVRQAERGQLAGPGVAIFTLADLDHVWLRAYVNEGNLGAVRLNAPADITTDSFPGKVYKGRVSFISPVAEFTPKTVETNAQRVTLVYRIRIDIYNPTHELLVGMPADARIVLQPPGR